MRTMKQLFNVCAVSAAGARTKVDDKLLTPCLGKLLGENPGYDIR